MTRWSGLAPVLLVLALAWLAWGGGSWSRGPSPPLVQVTDLSSRQVEPGDRVLLLGDGFPSGKPARVTFRGALHRPGERVESDAEVVAAGAVLGPQQVE